MKLIKVLGLYSVLAGVFNTEVAAIENVSAVIEECGQDFATALCFVAVLVDLVNPGPEASVDESCSYVEKNLEGSFGCYQKCSAFSCELHAIGTANLTDPTGICLGKNFDAVDVCLNSDATSSRISISVSIAVALAVFTVFSN